VTDCYTKQKLVEQIAKKEKLHPRTVSAVIESFFQFVHQGLVERKRFEFRKFGVFSVVCKKQKIGRNPKKASAPIVIPEHYAVRFKPALSMKKVLEAEMIDRSEKK
jgi:integration host factor subunit beta